MAIPIEVTGIIRSGEHAGRYVRVQDDSVNTGGYLILIWWSELKSKTGVAGYDDWVENEASLEQYWRHKKWLVEWSAPSDGVATRYGPNPAS